METIIVKTKEVATRLLPKSGYMSIRLKQQGDGTGTLDLIIQGNAIAKISGGVFIDNGVEKTEMQMNEWADARKVKLYEKEAYIYLPDNPPAPNYQGYWGFKEIPAIVNPNAPIVDYNSRLNKLRYVSGMFKWRSGFNQPIYGVEIIPELANLNDGVSTMFDECINFNQEVEHLNTKGIQKFDGFLSRLSSFNKGIAKLDVTSAISMRNFAGGSIALNQSVKGWKTANVVDFGGAFNNCISMDQDLSVLDYNKEVILEGFINWTATSPSNYDKLLEKLASYDWTGRTNPKIFDAVGVKYSSKGASFRTTLINAGWTINDGGLAS
ncbi:hypothetical protein BAX93_05585 [Elizabethkingia meningoseptica]|uniref:BspA family leucine-rich repeat surface protein n=1 Tax=Elizabethkingia meningoseptica TaxID=238 RepID=UPI00099A10E3|nr:BspA family leucine-rich repeat surface protein [Elizabethkingia meningoseptica]OPC11972.1 hypothetical protein BAX93_05585 [Elizabethkingia meningoseptica]